MCDYAKLIDYQDNRTNQAFQVSFQYLRPETNEFETIPQKVQDIHQDISRQGSSFIQNFEISEVLMGWATTQSFSDNVDSIEDMTLSIFYDNKINTIVKSQTSIPKKRKGSKINKKRVIEPEQQYPTKNFLQNFKGAHLDFLAKYFTQKQLRRFSIIARLKGKTSMSRALYEELYNVQQFQPVFMEMFLTRYLYRSMMISRSEIYAKKNHEKKITVLQQAFFNKKFPKIN